MPDTIDGHPYPLLTGENNPPKDIQELAQSLADGNWASYTPALTGITGTATATWSRQGKLITVEFRIDVTGGASGDVLISKPVNSANNSGALALCSAALAVRNGALATRRALTVVNGGLSTVFFIVDSATTAATVNATVPWAWTTGDTISGYFQYRAA